MNEQLKTILPELDNGQREKFCRYYEMLLEWNARVNLTAITEKTQVAQKHFADSLFARPLLKENARVADVGTGAGFPGVPLLITRPDLSLTLIDSLEKRLRFLEAVLKELGLTAELVHARAEDAGRMPRFRGTFDAALSRAVAPLPTLLELTVPLLRVGGSAIASKGDAAAELAMSQNAARVLRVELSARQENAAWGMRTLVIATKLGETAAAYPRKAGLPAKRPL